MPCHMSSYCMDALGIPQLKITTANSILHWNIEPRLCTEVLLQLPNSTKFWNPSEFPRYISLLALEVYFRIAVLTTNFEPGRNLPKPSIKCLNLCFQSLVLLQVTVLCRYLDPQRICPVDLTNTGCTSQPHGPKCSTETAALKLQH